MITSITKTPRSLRSLFMLGIATLGATSAGAETLYGNGFAGGQNDLDRLDLYRGVGLASVVNNSVGGRSGPMLRCLHTRESGWESILGSPPLDSKAAIATIRYSVLFGGDGAWQFRLQGKLPGLQPDLPQFGGNADDPTVWNKWSVRLMWISNTTAVGNNDDTKASPSIYIYDQNRTLGDTGTHHKAGMDFKENQWYDVRMSVKLNSYNGRIANSDGEVILFIDGVEVKRASNLKLRGNIPAGEPDVAAAVAKTQISKVAFHNYYGGAKDTLNTPQTIDASRCYIDSLQVYRGLTPP